MTLENNFVIPSHHKIQYCRSVLAQTNLAIGPVAQARMKRELADIESDLLVRVGWVGSAAHRKNTKNALDRLLGTCILLRLETTAPLSVRAMKGSHKITSSSNRKNKTKNTKKINHKEK